MSRNIIFILEGEDRENQICKSIERNFCSQGTIIRHSFCNDIYELYLELKKEDYVDIIEVLRERCEKKGRPDPFPDIKNRDKVSEIFLFFDLEIQDDKFSFDSLREMVEHFNEETEHGKLYISYPMIESIRDVPSDDNFIELLVTPEECKGSVYKQLSSQRGHKKYQDIRKFDKNIWNNLVEISMRKAVKLTAATDFLKPENGQALILQAQIELEKSQNKIAVLNSFPFYLSDYYGFESFTSAG